jgi:competence protein ComEC
VLFAPAAFANQVTPRPEVRHGVTVREEPRSDSARVGVLKPGDRAHFLSSVPSWHEIRLPDGSTGFVPKRWTVVTDAVAPVPFEVHFVDVGTGDAAILDVGTGEMVIDGGNSPSILDDYALRTGIIQGPIELVVVTHGDTDHWKGLSRLLGFDGKSHEPHGVSELWEAGYDRDCRRNDGYDTFIVEAKKLAKTVRRPLSDSRVPAVVSGNPSPLTVAGLPGVEITVLHSDPKPDAMDCSYRINNASIVLMVKVDGVRILFTGDANGKERDGPSTKVGHVEEKLLALEKTKPGMLKADILKVPHHGSETASTDEFIKAVNPTFVIISASTTHHLPKSTVVTRYEAPHRTILRTDRDKASNLDHIVCARDQGGPVRCGFSDN